MNIASKPYYRPISTPMPKPVTDEDEDEAVESASSVGVDGDDVD
jgi:hypothetical protein